MNRAAGKFFAACPSQEACLGHSTRTKYFSWPLLRVPNAFLEQMSARGGEAKTIERGEKISRENGNGCVFFFLILLLLICNWHGYLYDWFYRTYLKKIFMLDVEVCAH